ncbi:rho GTPase-activating protein 12-like isoform X2 [Artemia franciscana]|uniref:Rho GTPase-activating protein 15 n=1 Tax=Artemia franciscana TaxID=6661 RepID=A0AA88L056_ARTSF|nr:hypothetical protein QYM36_012571 [Artemia franciscana]
MAADSLSTVRVLFGFEYTPSGHNKQVRIHKDEELFLLRKANSLWWQVIRPKELIPFYAPAEYLEETGILSINFSTRARPKKANDSKLPLGRKRSSSFDCLPSPEKLHGSPQAVSGKRSSWAVSTYSTGKATSHRSLKLVNDIKEFRRSSAPDTVESYEKSGEKMTDVSSVEQCSNKSVIKKLPSVNDESDTVKFDSTRCLLDDAKSEIKPASSQIPKAVSKLPLPKPVPPKLPPKFAKKPMPAPRENIKLRHNYINLNQNLIAQPSIVDSTKPSDDIPTASVGRKPPSRKPIVFERQKTVATIDLKLNQERKVRPQIDLNKYKSAKPLDEKPKMPPKSKTYVAPIRNNQEVKSPTARKGMFSRLFSKESDAQPVRKISTEKLVQSSEKTKKVSTERLKSPLFARKEKKNSKQEALLMPPTINEDSSRTDGESPSLFVSNPLLQFIRQPSLRGNKKQKASSPGSVETLSSAECLDSSSELEDKGSKNSLDSLGSAFNSESTSGIISDSPVTRSPSSQEEQSSFLNQKAKLGGSSSDPSGRKSVYANVNYCTYATVPPSPGPKDIPIRQWHDGWAEYVDLGRRTYYYQTGTGAKSWKPPRKRTGSPKPETASGDEENQNISEEPSPVLVPICERPKLKRELSTFGVPLTTKNDINGNNTEKSRQCDLVTVKRAPIPAGWEQKIDPTSKEKYYEHPQSASKWFSSVDEEGRLYYFEENSNESVWALPDIQPQTKEGCAELQKKILLNENPGDSVSSRGYSYLAGIKHEAIERRLTKDGSVDRRNQAKSQIFDTGFQLSINRGDQVQKTASLPRDTTQLPYLKVIRQGQLSKTKITENGKKIRKNWSSSYGILSDQMLLLYKDAKSATQSRTAASPAKPELSLDLNGATIEWCSNKSSRKNVFQLSTVFGLQLLLQDEDGIEARQWYEAIRSAISQLPCGLEVSKTDSNCSSSCEYLERPTGGFFGLTVDDGKKSKLGRTKSTKTEPVFGSTLKALATLEKMTVPKFVQKIISVIEAKEEFLEADGLYRASGNLSQVQKIRLNADQYKFECIDTEEDVHVLAGALKLFFRELMEPAIPTQYFEKSLEISSMRVNRADRVKKFRELLLTFPKENYETLKFLFTHLLKVTEYREKNRMQISNLAIVFGPTLMWPATESLNLALDMMQQNLVIECLLLEFKQIFVK